MTTELRRLLSEGTTLPWSNDGAGIEGGDYSEVIALETRGAAFMQYEVLKLSDADKALILGAINALPHLLAVVDAAAVLDHAQHPWAGGHGPNGPTIDAAWRDLRNALRALEAGR